MIKDRIAAALKEADEGNDSIRCCTLRLMLTAIRDRDLAHRAEDGSGSIGEAEVVSLLVRMVAQRAESIAEYEESGQLELAERERQECEVVREFLPRPLTGTEYDAAISGAIAETHATSIRDMGKVMSVLRTRYPGRLDFCDANARVKAALG